MDGDCQKWPGMTGVGPGWSEMAGDDRAGMAGDVQAGMAANGQGWPGMAGNGRGWSEMAGNDWEWPGTV